MVRNRLSLFIQCDNRETVTKVMSPSSMPYLLRKGAGSTALGAFRCTSTGGSMSSTRLRPTAFA